jgi:hypothetical protein
MINTIQVFSVLPGIIQSFGSYLRELASSQKARRDEWVRRADIALPVCMRGLLPSLRLSIIKESFVITVPAIGFDREGVRGIDGSLVMSVDL